MTSYRISIDPGTNNTGWCLWADGKPIKLGVISPNKKYSFWEKAIFIHRMLDLLISEYSEQGNFSALAVEEFEQHRNRPMLDMMKCARIQGVICGLGYSIPGVRVVVVSKHQIRKQDSRLIAKEYGFSPLEHKQDAIDALQIGVCAGFDRILLR